MNAPIVKGLKVRYYKTPYIYGVILISLSSYVLFQAFPMLISYFTAQENIKRVKTASYYTQQVQNQLKKYKENYGTGTPKTQQAYNFLKSIYRDNQHSLLISPANSYAWYLHSEMRARLKPDDPQIFNFLDMSYSLGPREGWIASRRLAFSLQNWELLNNDTKKTALKDLHLLTGEPPYHKYLAKIFISADRKGKLKIYSFVQDTKSIHMNIFRKSLANEGWCLENNIIYCMLSK